MLDEPEAVAFPGDFADELDVARAVVSGLGIAAPTGLGVEEYWQATLEGRCAVGVPTRFDTSGYPATLAAEIPDFVARDRVPGRLLRQTDRATQLGLVATGEALADAGLDLDRLAEYDVGVITAASAGGIEFGQRELGHLWSKGKQFVSAYQSFAWFFAATAGQISIRHRTRGPSGVLVTEQSGGIDALGQARRVVRKGTPVVISGSVDGGLCPWGWMGQMATGRLSVAADPAGAFRPFAADADGYVPGEGGAIVIVEDAESAKTRGLGRGYGEIAGYAATFDPSPKSVERALLAGRPVPRPGLRRAADLALCDAGVRPDQVDVVFADAAGVPELDRIEAEVLRELFGPYGVPVTAPKTMTGRLIGGGASLDVATALLALRDGVIPPTVNVAEPAAEYELDLVTEVRARPLRTALVLARGYGGFNSALVLRS
ncbi:ketosynthase chain-length factor [Catenulispora yoronensis]|uniref:ketosynthase chain-length factor n=1 Tax=Catenulispora yoronensis TaxID=450799 RepID=UPI0036373332